MSAAPKWTPGPWVLMTVPTSVGSCHKIGPFPNGDRVATFACVYADGHRLGIDDTCDAAVELAANARLIAAAPDLLRELEHLVRLIEPCIEDVRIPGLATLNGAKAAIAKAKGEA